MTSSWLKIAENCDFQGDGTYGVEHFISLSVYGLIGPPFYSLIFFMQNLIETIIHYLLGTIVCTVITGIASVRSKLPYLAVCALFLTAIAELLCSFCSSYLAFAFYAVCSGFITMSYLLLRTVTLQVW